LHPCIRAAQFFAGPAGTFEARERCSSLQDFSLHMRIMTTKWQRAEFIETRSREMAESGKYSDFMEIEFELCRQGFPEARGLLDNPTIRLHLNKLCQHARRSKPNA
jgi:hypothetical protein